MKRAFYRNPLHAAVMAQEFGMRFQIHHSSRGKDYGYLDVTALLRFENDDFGSTTFLEATDGTNDYTFDASWTGNLYVHDESMGLLEPKIGDLMRGSNNMVAIYVTFEMNPKPSAHIVQRDGKPFFAPEWEG